MFKDVFSLFDSYSLRARLMPALFTLVPVLLGVAAWFPGELTQLGGLLGFVGLFGGAIFLAQVARDRGKNLEKGLFAQWGGVPSMTIQRHRDPYLNQNTKKRYHAALAALIPGITIPSEEEENADGYSADQVYLSCSDYLRERTRSTSDYPLLFTENVNYGTRRNLLGLKLIGVSSSLLGLISSLWAVTDASKADLSIPVVCSSVCILILLWWVTQVTAAWVKIPAYAYAERLLASSEILQNKTK